MTATPQFRWQAVGRRKTSVARVYLTPGTGKRDINGRTLGDYFPRPSWVQHIQQSFTATDTLGAFDVKAHVDGGGQAGQAGALRLGIARALVEADGQHRTKLRAAGLMTRDPRAVERKKPGQPGARSLARCCPSASTSARAMPSRSAPACPACPPPSTCALTSNAPSVSVAVKLCWMCCTSDGRGK